MNYGSDRGQQSFDYSAPYLPRWKALPLVVSALGVIALPFVAGGDSQDFSSSQSTSPVVHHRPIDQIALSTFEDTTPLKTDEVEQAWEHTQITYVDLRTGAHLGSGAERLARASLSLSKLYIADYVFDHGTQKEKEQAVEMIRKSDDDIADKLFDAYPNCIDSVAKKYQLEATQTYGRWGYSYTSTYDVVHFIVSLLRTDPDSPVLEAMRNVAPKPPTAPIKTSEPPFCQGCRAVNLVGPPMVNCTHRSASVRTLSWRFPAWDPPTTLLN